MWIFIIKVIAERHEQLFFNRIRILFECGGEYELGIELNFAQHALAKTKNRNGELESFTSIYINGYVYVKRNSSSSSRYDAIYIKNR